MATLEFSSYNKALLAAAQINLAKRKAGEKTAREKLPVVVTKDVSYTIEAPIKAEYLDKVRDIKSATPVADTPVAEVDQPK